MCLLHVARAECLDQLATLYLRRIHWMKRQAREDLEQRQREKAAIAHELVSLLRQFVRQVQVTDSLHTLDQRLVALTQESGGADAVLAECDRVLEYGVNDPRPFLLRHYPRNRALLMAIVDALPFDALKPEEPTLRLMEELPFLADEQEPRLQMVDLDPSLIAPSWNSLVQVPGAATTINRRQFEIYAFCELAESLKAGDVFIPGSLAYSDYRANLIGVDTGNDKVQAFMRDRDFPKTPEQFVDQLRNTLRRAAHQLDELFKLGIAPCKIDSDGTIHMPRERAVLPSEPAQKLAEAIEARLPQRHLLDVLANVDGWTQWTRHFGPLSGEAAQLEDPRGRYLLASFAYGCNLGPTQAARHLAGNVTPHMLSFVNRRHIDPRKLRAASTDIIDAYARFDLQRLWGSGIRAAADGTHLPIYDDNPFAAYHWRYRGMAGVAYRHVADSYIAIFSRFIPCGVAEATFILEGLLRNLSAVRPRILHSDTRGQGAMAFALSYLLGIDLRPRIKNWHDLVFYKPDPRCHYQHLNALFRGTVNWGLIADHWQEYMRTGASVQAGSLSSSWLLTRLNSRSQRNQLFQAFHELGRVIRTIHMLEVLADSNLLRPGGSQQNKV